MNVHSLLRKLQDGRIALNKNGHRLSSKYLFERLTQKLEWYYDHYTKGLTDPECDDEHKEYLERALERMESDASFSLGKEWMPAVTEVEIQCHGCGSPGLTLRFQDENTLRVQHYEKGSISCALSGPLQPIRTRIRIPTGNLTFVNHFGRVARDSPTGKEYGHEYSLNNMLGQTNIAKHLASKNIGYGQVGNTSIDIYINEARDKLKIYNGVECASDEIHWKLKEGEDLTPEEMENKVFLQDLEKTYTYVGKISLSMWRWMCADKAVMKGSGLPIIYDDETVTCEVERGWWNITHYYGIVEKENGLVVSELILEK